MTDTQNVIAYLDRELGNEKSTQRVVSGFDQDTLDEVVAHYGTKSIEVALEARNNYSVWANLARK